MKTTIIRQKSGKKILPKSNSQKSKTYNYREVKIKNRKYPTVSDAIRSLLLKKESNLTDTSAYHEIAELCNVSYPLVSQLAHEMLSPVRISKEERYENVIAATKKLSQTYPLDHIVRVCRVSRPCIETIMKVKKLLPNEKK